MTTTGRAGAGGAASAARISASLIGWLFLVELTSGVLQGYYVPLASDIVKHLGVNDADYNWFDAAQLLLSAIVVPVLAKLGDMFGHKRVLLVSIALTAAASWWLAFAGGFGSYLVAFALQGFYVVWLPLEVALIFDRGRRGEHAVSATRRAAGLLVVALETGAIAGALVSGMIFSATGSVPGTLIVPAVCATLVFFAVLFGVPESEPLPGRRLDSGGFALLALALLLVTGGLTLMRQEGPGELWVWLLIALGLAVLVPFGLLELRRPDPAIDLRVMRQPAMWPVIATAGLIGISLLGAQAPLSTFAGTDPANGYGLGLSASQRSLVIGVYLISLIVGALLLPVVSSALSPRTGLIAASALVAVGYLLFLPFHASTLQVLVNMIIAGFGAGGLVGALPAAAAAMSPRGQTGVATAMTNTTKTIGGSVASAVFGVALLAGASGAVASGAASLAGYLTVWAICGGGAVAAVLLLLVVPRSAFSDAAAEAPADPLGTLADSAERP
ncbi:MFS transporter [Gryllotalpicola ginsengisoli]|uniref:MFS transporter n=1 Tax=Gryllotalpicola ginsengisoli TaxID=444608 RepID=UPI0003B6C84A|nr:MFS transporter [Gryllotalpicola ginsengisoli]